MMYQFEIRGYIVPYVRMTRRGKFIDPRAQRYLTSQERIGYQFKHQMRDNGWEMLPDQTPLRCAIWIRRRSGLHTSDLDNIIKAILDASQGIVFRNDLWIDEINTQRMLSDDKIDRAELRIGLIGAIE